MHRFDVKTIKATQNSKRDQITMNLHRFDVQTIKNVELRCKPFKTAKVQKWSKYNDLHRFDVKNIKTTLNYESDQMDVKTSKNVELRRKTFKTAKLQKWSKYNDLHRFDVKNIKTMLNYESDHWTPKRAKMLSYVAKHSKQRWTTKVISLRWIACIWHQNEQKCRVRSKIIQNNAKLQKWSKYNDLHRFDVKTSKNDKFCRKTFKTTLNYESDQIIMNCINLTSKRAKSMSYVSKHSELRKPTNLIKL